MNQIPQTPQFKCPFCQSTMGAVLTDKVSGAGWIVFTLLLFFCLPLCFIGLMIREDMYHCKNCRMKIG